MLLAVSLMVAGCLTGGKGPKPEDLIRQSLGDFKAGMESKDIDKVMSSISDNFSHYEWGDKASMRSFLADTFSQGDLDDAEVTYEDVEIVVEGDEATAYPVELMAVFGSATIELTFTNEGDAWLVTGMEIEGI